MTIESLEDLKKQKQAESPATSYALETAYNIPSSTAKFVRDTIEPILSPIDTAKSVIELSKYKKHLVVEGNTEVLMGDTPVKLMSKLHQIYSGTVKFESGNSMVLDLSKAKFIKNKLFYL